MSTGTKIFLLFCLLLTGCATPPIQSRQPAASVAELTAVNQYWLHYRLQDDWGLRHMARKSREEPRGSARG